MSRYLLRMFERTAVLEVGGDASSTKCVAAGGIGQGGRLSPPFDHRQDIFPPHRIVSKFVSFPNRAEERPFLVAPDLCGLYPSVQIFGEVVVARHLVVFTAFLMEPQPGTLAVFEIVLHVHRRCGPHAGEGKNHHADKGAVAQPAELARIDRVQELLLTIRPGPL
jgi:hypothetical protein